MKLNCSKNSIVINDTIHIDFSAICSAVRALSNDVIYIAGSIVEGYIDEYAIGMGNRNSDLDVFVIREHSEFTNTPATYYGENKRTFFVDDFPIGLDVEVIDKHYFQRIIGAVNVASIEENQRIATVFGEKDEVGDIQAINSLLNRFLHSICIFNANEYQQLQQQCYFDHFLNLYKAYIVASLDHACQDVLGNIDVNQLDAALLCARKVINKTMVIVLADNNIFVDRERWVFLKFNNLYKSTGRYSELYAIYVMLNREDLSNNFKCAEAITSSIHVCRRTVENILMKEIMI